MFNWIKAIWGTKEEVKKLKCPKCGCDNIEFSTIMNNMASVIHGDVPNYVQMARCASCGYKTTGDNYLEAFYE